MKKHTIHCQALLQELAPLVGVVVVVRNRVFLWGVNVRFRSRFFGRMRLENCFPRPTVYPPVYTCFISGIRNEDGRFIGGNWERDFSKTQKKVKKWGTSENEKKPFLQKMYFLPKQEQTLFKDLRHWQDKIKSSLNSKRCHAHKSYDNGRYPTQKRNLVKEQQILINIDGSHPEENYGREMRGSRVQTTRVQLTLTLSF